MIALPTLKPLIEDAAGYNRKALRADALAGLTVALFAIPQSMAYASIAEIPVQYGLYSAVVVTLVAGAFSRCGRLIHGPTNAIVVMIADVQLKSVLAQRGIEPTPEAFMQAVFLLTLMIGCLQLLGAMFRLGDLTGFISSSVIVGFTVAAAALIIVRQIPKLLGIEVPPGGGTLTIAREVAGGLGQAHLPTLAMGVGCAVFIVFYRRARKPLLRLLDRSPAGALAGRVLRHAPGALFAIVGASLILHLTGLDARGVALVSVDRIGLPPFSLPLFDLELIRALLPSAVAIALVGQLEAVTTARIISRREGESFNANDQLWGEALPNIAGAFFSSFAGSSSFTRSALNVDLGARTRFSAMFCAGFVALFLLFFSPMLNLIPLVALSGVLVAVALTLIETGRIGHAFRASWTEAVILSATALWGILFSLEWAILVGVALSFFFYIPRSATLTLRRLTRGPDGNVREARAGEAEGGPVGVLDVEGAVFFAALPAFERALAEFARADHRVKILGLRNAHHLDAATSEELIRFVRAEGERGVQVMLSGIRPAHDPVLRRVGLIDLVGEAHCFRAAKYGGLEATARAMCAGFQRTDRAACSVCGSAAACKLEDPAGSQVE